LTFSATNFADRPGLPAVAHLLPAGAVAIWEQRGLRIAALGAPRMATEPVPPCAAAALISAVGLKLVSF
jgi:hypothetical protein